MQEITSVNNNLVKETVKLQQKKYRDKENKFLLEGFKCIFEAFDAGIEIEYAFVSDVKKYEFSIEIGRKQIWFKCRKAVESKCEIRCVKLNV